jgi:hypothetical protein
MPIFPLTSQGMSLKLKKASEKDFSGLDNELGSW